ncbi:MAG: carbonic anhydrase [Hyphomicrobiaceae bacterium]
MTDKTRDDGADAVDPDILDAAQGHARFREKFERERDLYRRIAISAQRPRLLWIGCSDSRVVPSEILSADPGELFEVRNIANTVPPAGAGDVSVGAAITYAVEHLEIDDIVVCGHTGCGGIKALAGDAPLIERGELGRWVSYTRPAHRLIRAAGVPADERHVETVKAHIHFQLDNLMTYPLVARRVAERRLDLHGWLYVMEEGELLTYDQVEGDWIALRERVPVGGPAAR